MKKTHRPEDPELMDYLGHYGHWFERDEFGVWWYGMHMGMLHRVDDLLTCELAYALSLMRHNPDVPKELLLVLIDSYFSKKDDDRYDWLSPNCIRKRKRKLCRAALKKYKEQYAIKYPN